MDFHLKNIQEAAARNMPSQASSTPNYSGAEHDEMVLVLCRAMAAGVPPADTAAAAGLSVAELFNTLRGHP